jgi:hypothetical protein
MEPAQDGTAEATEPPDEISLRRRPLGVLRLINVARAAAQGRASHRLLRTTR